MKNFIQAFLISLHEIFIPALIGISIGTGYNFYKAQKIANNCIVDMVMLTNIRVQTVEHNIVLRSIVEEMKESDSVEKTDSLYYAAMKIAYDDSVNKHISDSIMTNLRKNMK